MRTFLLWSCVLALSTASTLLILRLRSEELHRSATPAFTVGVAVFNVVIFGLLFTLVL